MASVTVFVDDAVRGELPRLCARDGVPTRDALSRHEEIGSRSGLGVAWLLLLAGPLGWLGLLVIALSKSGRGEHLHVELPMSDGAYQRLRQARRLRDRSLWTFLLATAASLLLFARASTTLPQLALVLAGAVCLLSLVAMIVGSLRVDRASVGVSLDASRRWVTLTNVHPQFAAACEAHTASRSQRA